MGTMHRERTDNALRQIRSAADKINEEVHEQRRFVDALAEFWLKYRRRIPVDERKQVEMLFIGRDMMDVNSALYRAQDMGLISRDIKIPEPEED